MVKAYIVSVGNEILSGQTVDSNSAWLAGRLLSVGMPVAGVCVVGDDLAEITEAIGRGANKADVVLITGGLGPTDDDITRQGLCEYLGVGLEFHEELLMGIKAFFDKRNMTMALCNRNQAFLPAGAKAIVNEVGTAPGVIAESEGKLIVSMPGVPVEMKDMFDEQVFGEIERRSDGGLVVVKKLRCFGMGESSLVELLGDMMERGRNPLVNCTVHGSVITLHIVASADTKMAAYEMIDAVESQLRGMLGDMVFGEDDATLAGVVGDKLAEKGLKIAVAESCTGGFIGKMLTDEVGASIFFEYGWITYSNPAKVSQLGVDASTIERFGAVSEDVAVMMARGARKNANADIGVGVTGIAGPTGGSEEKPVGTVYIAVDINGKCEVKKHVFS
ncbi:MAG: competence/damage-inducible protein A, partial [Anaerohalosphaera sp.]|nr:competence/damage-inducible protein A [Anaerohalosphaera sp.]